MPPWKRPRPPDQALERWCHLTVSPQALNTMRLIFLSNGDIWGGGLAEEQEAAVYRKQHPRRAQGRSIPGWVFMRSTSSTQQTAQLFKIIITFMEHAMEMKGGNIIGEEMEMDHDTWWKVEVQSPRRTKKSIFQRGCEGQWTVEWN